MGGEYSPASTKGGSVFDIPVDSVDATVEVQARTTRMSTPHLIDYTIALDGSSLEQGSPGQDAPSADNDAADSADASEDSSPYRDIDLGCDLVHTAPSSSHMRRDSPWTSSREDTGLSALPTRTASS